jgi:hypothetical protein
MSNGTDFRTLEAGRPYKWIAREIENSDPYKDYEKIFRLSMEYVGDSDFMSNMLYALTFSNFITNPWGAQAVWREDGGKVLHQATERMHETLYHNSTWWFYGPNHPKTLESIGVINKRHQYHAKRYPGAFSHAMDYTYVLAFLAALNHRFRLRLGLSGFNNKQQIAAHLCLKEFAKHFLVEQPGKPNEPWVTLDTFDTFPKDWDSVVAFCEDVESNHFEKTEAGHMIAEALIDHFAYTRFHPLLRRLGRAIVISLSLPQLIEAHQIKPANPILARVIIFVFGTWIWFAETFLPDPKIATQEVFQQNLKTKKLQCMEERRTLDRGFLREFEKNHQGTEAWCPFKVNEKST